jgi:hypothetical protein
MQLLDRCLEVLASALRHPLALGIATAGVLMPLAKSQTLSGTFQCQSIVINYATGPSSLAVGFTTPAVVAGRNPQLPLNGEFEYYPGNLNLYQSYWVMYQGNQLFDLGLVGIGGSSLLPDSDANGIPNFAERGLPANVVASLVAVSSVDGGSAGGTITLNRTAGQTSGSAVTRFTSGAVFNGTWNIPLMDVTGTYNPGARTLQLRATSSVFAPGNFTGTYQVNSDDSVTMSNILLQLDSGNRLTATPVTFTRFGKTYRAIVEFVDGNLSTGYPDFRRWTLQLTDPADNDGDGVPNLSDSTPSGSPPTVVTQPVGVTRTVGQSVTFSVAASGSGPLGYQWYLNGSPIAGANTTTLVLPSVRATDAGTYTAGVRNAAGEVLSNPAVLTVNPAPIAPVITAQPQPVTVSAGQTAQFSVTTTGTAPLSYQWQRNGVNIAGATAANWSVVNAQSANAGSYRVIVSNSAGSVTSTAATLTVTPAVPPPVVLTQPAAATRTVGQSVTFTIAASGSGSLAYQWYLDGIPIAGANAPSYTLAAVALTDAGAYTAGVRNTAGEVLSNPALLVVNPAPIPKLNLRLEANGRLTFTWTGVARLAWSPTLTGSFSPVPNAASGYQALPGGDQGFYRLVP